MLNIYDGGAKQLVVWLVACSMTGHQVSQFLTRLIEQNGASANIVCDNGTEFTCKAMFFYRKDSGVNLHFIRPGQLTQTVFFESLNDRFQAEFLNQHRFRTLEEAKGIVAVWHHHYNHVRPHRALGSSTPAVYTK